MKVNYRLLGQVLLATWAGGIAGVAFAYFRVQGLYAANAAYGFGYWLSHGSWGTGPWLGAVIFGCVVAGVTQRANYRRLGQVLIASAKANYRLLSQVLIAAAVGWLAGVAFAYSEFKWPASFFVDARTGHVGQNIHGIIYWLFHWSMGPWPWLGAVIRGGARSAWWRACPDLEAPARMARERERQEQWDRERAPERLERWQKEQERERLEWERLEPWERERLEWDRLEQLEWERLERERLETEQ